MERTFSVANSLWVWLGAKQLADISASLNTIVISVYVLTLFDNPAMLGIILALKMVGSVLGAFLVPSISKRWGHRRILIGSDFANAGLTLFLALSPIASHHTLFLALPLFMGLFQGTFHVALYSQSHLFLGHDKRHRMNSLLASMDGVAVISGGILASVVYGMVSVQTIFLMSAAAYFASGFAFVRFSGDQAVTQEVLADINPSRLKGLSAPILRTLIGSLGLVFTARFVEAFGSATHNVGLPILSAAYDPENNAFLVGWIMSIWGLGKMAAAIVTPRMVSYLEQRRIGDDHTFIAFLILTFLFFVGVFFVTYLPLILAIAFFAGIFDASAETVYYGLLQHSRVARTDQLISLSYLVERAGMGLGMLTVAYAFSVGSVGWISALFYLGSIVSCLLLITLSARGKSRRAEIINATDERFWQDLEPVIFDQERIDRAPDECLRVLDALNIRGRLRILDVGCGLGRHALCFAHMHNHVEGIDSVPYLIEKARSQMEPGTSMPIYHVGDAATFTDYGTSEFDCAVSFYHSLGYSDDSADDERILANLHSLLRPGGKVFFELIDPDGFAPGQVVKLTTPVDNDIYYERIEIGSDRRSYVLTIHKRSASHLVYQARHRLFSRATIANLFETVGFHVNWPSPDLLINYPGGSRKFCVIGERGT